MLERITIVSSERLAFEAGRYVEHLYSENPNLNYNEFDAAWTLAGEPIKAAVLRVCYKDPACAHLFSGSGITPASDPHAFTQLQRNAVVERVDAIARAGAEFVAAFNGFGPYWQEYKKARAAQ